MTRINNIFKEAFKLSVIFCFSFIWINYYYRNTKKSLFLSILTTLLVDILLYAIFNIKNKKTLITKKDFENIQNIALQLLFATKKEINDYIKKIFCINNNQLIISTKQSAFKVVPILNKTIINNDNLSSVLNSIKNLSNFSNIIIVCNSYTDQNLSKKMFFKDKKIFILTLQELYTFIIKQKNIFPKEIIKIEKIKYSFNDLIKISINKTKTKTYFYFGITTLLLSIFTFYNIYYLIFGSMLLILSLISFYSKNQNIDYNNTPFEITNKNNTINIKEKNKKNTNTII